MTLTASMRQEPEQCSTASPPGSDPFTSSQRSPFGHSSERQSPQSTFVSSHTQNISLQLYFSIICSLKQIEKSSIMSVPRLALCPHPLGGFRAPRVRRLGQRHTTHLVPHAAGPCPVQLQLPEATRWGLYTHQQETSTCWKPPQKSM